MTIAMPTQEDILNALRIIIDPDFNKDIVSLGFVKNIQIKDGHVGFDIALTTPACPVKSEFEQKALEAVSRIPGVLSVKVNMTSPSRQPQVSASQKTANPLSQVGSMIAVSSCKGGVGKSTVAAHLAQELDRRGFKIGLLDADIHGPSVPALFHFDSTQIYTNPNNQLIPLEKNNLKIMSFGFLLGDAPAVMRGPILTRYVQQLLFNTEWGKLDYLFIDMPPGTGDVQLTITQSLRLNGAVIVTTPQTLSLIDVARGILMFERVNVPILGVIENMAFFVCDGCGKRHDIFGPQAASNLKERFGIELLAELPLLKKFTRRVDQLTGDEFIKKAVDHVVMALGKSSILERQIPKIEFNEKEVILIWKDASRWAVSNRALRLSCRCALCVNEMTGEKSLREQDIPPDIAAKEIIPLGNYAIGISWSDGHSSGIYPYEGIEKLIQMP